MFSLSRRAILVPALLILACGKPVDPSGKEDPLFVKASMAGLPAPEGPDRPLAADLAVEPVSMLVMFNRLQTPEKLQEALNKKPGQFSHIDIDKDSAPDTLTVAKKDTPDGHAFEIRARPSTGEFVVATMIFDPEWSYLGHYNGMMGGGASTVGRPLPVAGATTAAPPPPAAPAPVAVTSPAPAPAVADAPAAGPPAPAPAGAPAPVAGAIEAVPAGSAKEAGLQATH